MRTDTVIKQEGFSALLRFLDVLEAERFIALLHRQPSDYTEWRKNLWEDSTVEELSKRAQDFAGAPEVKS